MGTNSGKSVDPGLDENESELGVLVLSELTEVGSDSDGLLDDYSGIKERKKRPRKSREQKASSS